MTTPPQGPWGPGQPGGQPGGQHGGQGGQPPQQGGWGQQPPGQGQGGWGQQPQQGQPPHGQPPQQDQRPQQGGWGQQPGQPGQHGQPQQGQPPAGGWGQPPQQGGAYQQQSWGQRQQQQGGWHQQQGGPGQQWQPGGPGSKGPGGISKEKLPLVIGGGVVGLVVIGLLVFLGIRAFGGEDTPTSNPTTTEQPTGEPTGKPTTSTSSGGPGQNGELGNATGQAKTATEKLQGLGFGCSDLFNTSQGAHRGCFKEDGRKGAEAIFQFGSDGNIIAVRLQAQDDDNFNNAQVAFDQVLQALGNDTFGADQVKKVQDAVKTGQRSDEVGTTWGEFQLSNQGQSVRLSGHKSGEDSMDLPDQSFDTTQAQLVTALKAKGYVCTTSCKKDVGKYGYQRVFFFASSGKGIKDIEISASGEAEDAKKALPAALGDAFGALKGGNVAAVKAYVDAHNDGKPYSAYVGGWKVEISGNSSASYTSQQVSIEYESFYA
ncbi:hypothetical protein E0H92_29885 [Kribbella speibonae]|uniref:Uncharacterized protein n=1 Tax=Kribbella speibonae TaxID=1572660 RepID=A0A4R0IL28_9ACTN|nr:hypothetical protein E0H58_24040 [Kribbella speibonae]TCC34233.1 hypothetical protein E0H92_29885 [Kribbella speibonae]